MKLTIDGPAGNLEAIYSNPEKSRHGALLCHPHPSFGGSMHDGVLGIVAQTMTSCGAPDDDTQATPWAHLRFNFRGVGSSAGTFDDGRGEQADLVAAWDWLTSQKDWQELTLVGYSFGAAMAWAARNSCKGLTRLILIAPPTAAMPFTENDIKGSEDSAFQSPAFSTHIVVGSDDDYCDLSNLPSVANTTIIDGGDHFFSIQANSLAKALAQVLQSR